jgi:hypothetical protein
MLQVPELAKEQVQRHGSSTTSGEAREAWGTRDKATDGSTSHQGYTCLRQLGFSSPMAMVATKGGYMTPRLESTAPTLGTKKNFFLKGRGEPPLVTKVLCLTKPPASYLQLSHIFYCILFII